MTAADKDALKQVNRSGFPFQLKVEHDIRATEKVHHWSVASREHAWDDLGGNAGFIDLALKHKEFSTFRIAIECKRVKSDDARQLQWLFMVEQSKSDFVFKTSSFEVEADLAARVWDDVQLMPASLESQFCVLHGDEPRRPLLESLAKGLLKATEGLAQEEINIAQSLRTTEEPERPLHVRLFLFPMIVTNAKIAVCRFEPTQVDIEQGLLHEGDAEIFEVPMIRFRKSLATEFPTGVFYHLEAANKARERSVLVVNANHLTETLETWQIERLPGRNYAIESLVQARRNQNK